MGSQRRLLLRPSLGDTVGLIYLSTDLGFFSDLGLFSSLESQEGHEFQVFFILQLSWDQCPF